MPILPHPGRFAFSDSLRAYPNNPVYFWYEYTNDNQAHARTHA